MKEKKTFEHRCGDRVYLFSCDSDSPLGEVKDALCHFTAHFINFEKALMAQLQEQRITEEKEECLVEDSNV